MNPGQAFTGNFVTALLVILASVFGFPLSTTTFPGGALFGIGIVNGTAKKKTILQILPCLGDHAASCCITRNSLLVFVRVSAD